jgi:hypothetical protein
MVQPKYSPEEALQKIKLMMKYDSSKTLNENKQLVTEQTATQAGGALAGGALATGAGASTAAALAGTLGATGSAVPIVGTAAGIIIGYGLGTLIDWAANHDYGEDGFKQVMSACSAKGVSKLVPQLSKADVRQIAYSIEDAKGTWNDDEQAIANALAKIPTVADLCAVDKRISGGLFNFLDNLTDSPDEWKMFTRPLAGMIEDTEIVLTPEEQQKSEKVKTPTPTTPKKFPPCAANAYKLGCSSPKINQLQGCLGNLVPDGKWGDKTQQRLLAVYPEYKQNPVLTDADIDKICKKTTPITPPQPQASVGGEEEIISFGADF